MAKNVKNNAVQGIVGKNLFNKSTVTRGKYVVNNTGNLADSPNGTHNASDFVELTPNTPYRISGTNEQGAFYDANKNYVIGFTNASSVTMSPPNAYFIRITVLESQFNLAQVEKGAKVTEYEPFSVNLDANTIKTPIPEEKLALNKNIVRGTPSKNLFDKSTVITGKYVSYSNGNLGTSSDGTHNASEYINILPNTPYKISGMNEQGAFYDGNREYISGFANATTVSVSPNNAYYIRLTIKNNQLDSTQLEKGTSITSYESFGAAFNADSIKKPIPEQKLNLGKDIVRGTPSKNLFDKATITPGFYVSYATGNLGILAGYNASDYISILPNTNYVISGTGEQLAFYDTNKVYISGLDFASKLKTTPGDAAYIRINAKDNQLSIIQLEKGITVTSYAPFGALISADQVSFPIPNAEIITKTVKPDGTGDYLSPKLANDAITDASHSKVYNIIIYPGTYTEIEWKLKPHINLIGKSKKTCWLKGELPDTATESEIQANSTIWIDDTNNLENLTITAKNMRYAVHDESSGRKKDWIRNIKNCHIEHYGNQPGKWTSQCAYGCGISSGAKIYAENTTFKSPFAPFSVHNNVDFLKPAFIHLKGCRLEYVERGLTPSSLRVQSLGSETDDIMMLEGCYLNAPIVHNDNPWLGNANATTHVEWQVHGYGNTPNITYSYEFDTGETDTLKFTV
ncbi:hypothetical protein [Bacillus mycoides]|uniref:hypothetical protein n=1 Tax=Bacillus mycoides TaxID=1405 RepID=UPI001C02BE53|nr:hypothetical protein [Bacillus mycoides]